jgi:holo-[acyl-carrier protein] synthase
MRRVLRAPCYLEYVNFTAAPGIGIDLVEVERFRSALEKGGQDFKDRLFTPNEQSSCENRADPPIHYAARWAAKEAAMKALGSGFAQGVGFKDFELLSDGSTPPQLILHGKAAELATERQIRGMRVSISHTDSTAAAVVLADS